MTGVGTGIGGDAVVEAFDKGLHVIVPLGSGCWALHTCDQHRPQMIVAQELGLIGCQRRVGHSLMAAIEHQSGYLFYRQLRGQVSSTLLSRETPILVGIE